MPRRDEIIANKATFADFSSGSISKDFAGEIADVLMKNTSVREISFNATDLVDDCFQIIANGLVARNQNNLVLNVDNTNLTEKSISAIKKLIDSKIIKTLLVYGVEGIGENTTTGIELKEYAKNNGVNISFDHPRKRTALGFFDKNVDEQKDISVANLMEEKLETKDSYPMSQNTFKK